jgi:hypothetical protein
MIPFQSHDLVILKMYVSVQIAQRCSHLSGLQWLAENGQNGHLQSDLKELLLNVPSVRLRLKLQTSQRQEQSNHH